MDIQGTVQISIKQFDELREKAGELDRCHMKIREIGELLAGLVESLDDAEYKERIAAIDATENLTDRQLTKACAEAAGTLKVIISEKNLRELVHQYIDGDESDGHHDIKHMKKAELRREMAERELNPLSGYSTTQLKAELRRRKQEYGKRNLI